MAPVDPGDRVLACPPFHFPEDFFDQDSADLNPAFTVLAEVAFAGPIALGVLGFTLLGIWWYLIKWVIRGILRKLWVIDQFFRIHLITV